MLLHHRQADGRLRLRRKPQLGPARTISAPVSWTVGHANLTFSGSWAPLLRNGKAAGLYLEGQGTVVYAPAFEPEGPVFAHEIAYQYWGIVVKMPSYQEQWITESFADFCSALFEGDYKGRRLYDKNVSAWRSQASDSHEKAPIPLANDFMAEDSRDRFRARRNLLYCKGPVLLNALYEELGDRVFLTWLKSTQATFRWKFATTKQMFDLLTFITKKDYTAFYNNYYWGLALPPKKM